ncbi:MAG TPA: hypothetical protein VG406_24990 [Isosphaeraceae bacterium]|nr:hypothetical protein [Isosphaeraceae bacterium]
MPSRKQGNNGGDGGAAQRSGVGERISDAGDQVREGFDQARAAWAHQYRQAEGMIARNPGQAVLFGFGLGLGVGLAVALLIPGQDRPWHERQLDRMRHMHWPEMKWPDALRR